MLQIQRYITHSLCPKGVSHSIKGESEKETPMVSETAMRTLNLASIAMADPGSKYVYSPLLLKVN